MSNVEVWEMCTDRCNTQIIHLRKSHLYIKITYARKF